MPIRDRHAQESVVVHVERRGLVADHDALRRFAAARALSRRAERTFSEIGTIVRDVLARGVRLSWLLASTSRSITCGSTSKPSGRNT